jgi:hypothetical protein
MKPFSQISGGIAEQDHVLVAAPLMMREPQKWNMFGAGKPAFPLGPDLGGVGTGKGGGDINPGERRGQKMDGISSWHGRNPEHRSLFLVNTGHVTCYSPEGVLLWQTLTKVRWGMDRRKAGESSLETLSVQPSLTALPLYKDQLSARTRSLLQPLALSFALILTFGTLSDSAPIATYMHAYTHTHAHAHTNTPEACGGCGGGEYRCPQRRDRGGPP